MFYAHNTEAVFEAVNGFFHVPADFVGGVPFFCATGCFWVSLKVLFRINVDYPPSGRRSTGIVTVTVTFGCFRFFVILPFHFGADELHGLNTSA